MEREYVEGTNKNPSFFVGTEVEGTPYLGFKTLFVVGIQPVEKIVQYCKELDIHHVFIGANLSFEATREWEDFLLLVHACKEISNITVDMTMEEYYTVNRNIPLILLRKLWVITRVVLPNFLNRNVTLKIDDESFGATNPGVLTVSPEPQNGTVVLHYTSWLDYKQDRILE
jgi:hypothetical protein